MEGLFVEGVSYTSRSMCFGVKLFLAEILAQLLAYCVALSSLVFQIPTCGLV